MLQTMNINQVNDDQYNKQQRSYNNFPRDTAIRRICYPIDQSHQKKKEKEIVQD